MKFQFDDGMQKKILTYSSVAAIAILLYFLFSNFFTITSWLSSMFHLISPFIFGFAIAFLLNKPMMIIEAKVLKKMPLKANHKRSLAAVIAVILGILVVGLFLALLIPQLIDSIFSLMQNAPQYIEDFQVFINQMIVRYELDVNQITALFGEFDIFNRLTTFFSDALPKMVTYSYQLTSGVFNIFLSIMAALYILIDKEQLVRHVKVANYALFPKQVADYFVRLQRDANDVFNNFIIGKAIDSLIIGVLCYIGLTVLNLPYALLLSVIVGTTNMIPVFGPFIGAVPGIFILLLIRPIEAVYFALFILVLQQFDGNILGPLILGDRLGLPSIWILFAVCVGGGLFGVIGMFIGVPVFAIVYAAIRELVYFRLKKKNMQIDDIGE
ncbi:MAG: AI-2E family transporter [Erysipelotrichaceae bacterium]|jgi:predicted PurR-regulated permease PerM|nr:AI-2E family transporter [Erysipelotrichaceae bacterium]